MDIECSAHADAMGNDVRMLQREIHAVVAAETASGDAQLPGRVLPANEWQEFVENVVLVLQMAKYSYPRMYALVVPTLGIDGIGTEDLQFAPLDFGRQHADHAP